jgi:hypothetical protein
MSPRSDFITGLIDDISGENWEDFDPDLDGARTALQDLLELEEL